MSKRSISQFFKGSSHNYHFPFPPLTPSLSGMINIVVFFFSSMYVLDLVCASCLCQFCWQYTNTTRRPSMIHESLVAG